MTQSESVAAATKKPPEALKGGVMLKRLGIMGLVVGCLGCSPTTEAPQAKKSPVYGAWGVDLAAQNSEIHPGDDFHDFANGLWLTNHPIPAERSSWGSFFLLREQAEARVRAVIESLDGPDLEPGSPEQKVGDYFRSWMNVEALDQRGLEPLQADLDRIRSIESRDALIAEFGGAPLTGGSAPFYAYVGINPINPDEHNVSLGLSGLGLPDRDYYLDDGEVFSDIRADYLAYVEVMLSHAGHLDPAESAQRVLAIETQIAKLQWPRAERRDRDKTYNPTTLDAFKAQHVAFPWGDFFAARGIVSAPSLNVVHPNTVIPLMALINEVSLRDWRAYLSFHIIDNHSDVLTQAIDDAAFEFRGKTLQGQEEQLTRWKRGVLRVGSRQGLGELIGQLYVDRHFPEASKQSMTTLVETLRAAYGERIRGLSWMGEATKSEALKKLAAFKPKIGFPDRWKELEAIEIDEQRLFENARGIRQFFWQEGIQKLGQKTDRAEWYMMPQTVNAYYNASFNEIVFPAAILEAPFFDPHADPAVNYGAIGAVIGHEMGHGFDDQGSKYDAMGVKRNWWTDEDLEGFKGRTSRLVEQFAGYESLPGQFIDGAFTLGENIGDLGGVEVALSAYRLSLDGRPAPVIDGYTGEQRFFLAYAQVWRVHRRDDLALQLLKSDSHSPPKYRINGIVRNVDAWYQAFNVGPEHALWLPREERVQIW